jgi:uncharacterized protein YgiM (DUF1202 family)
MNVQPRLRSIALLAGAALAVAVAAQPAAHAATHKSVPQHRAAAHKKKLTATPTPKISGTAAVGRRLTVKPGTWKPAGVTLKYRWYVGKTAIKGATAKTYVLPVVDVGKKLTVTVTGSKHGYTSVTKRSKSTAAVAKAALTATPTPTISGTAAVGSTLTAKPGTWKPAGVKLAYRWSAGGTAIAGATKPTYAPVPVDSGKTMTVTVTGTKAGYVTVSKTSAPTSAVTIDAVTMQAALRNCIDDQLDEPEGTPVTADQIEALTSLQCLSFGITDISPLADATNLVVLALTGNNLSSISALASMSQLTDLTLRSANVSNLTPLASLTHLTGLDLTNDEPSDPGQPGPPFPNHITDVSPLDGLTNLTYLDVSNNQITDLSPISALLSTPSLSFVQLHDQSVTLGTATVGTAFTLPAVTSPSGSTETLAIGTDSSATGAVANDSSSVTWTDAGSGTGEVTWDDSAVAFGSDGHAVFSGTFTQPVTGGCRASGTAPDC